MGEAQIKDAHVDSVELLVNVMTELEVKKG